MQTLVLKLKLAGVKLKSVLEGLASLNWDQILESVESTHAEAWRSVSISVFSGFQLRVPLASASAVFYHFKTLCNAASINSVLVKSAKKQQPYLN